MKKSSVGFIGLGIMGRPMAEHILRSGHPLTVYNRTRSKTEDLATRGARVAETPSTLAAAADIVIVMVTDSAAVEAVVAGPRGVLEGIRRGSVVVDMSTIAPETERRLEKELKARGAALVDAPVSGGDVGARDATLAIMAGGERDSFERVRPILELMGKTITYCGPIGSGQLTKLSNQILVSVTLLAVSEAFQFARTNGLDPGTLLEAVQRGAAGSWQLSNLGPRILARDFAPGFMIDLIQKDLRLVLQAGTAAGSPLPATRLVHELFGRAQREGCGREGTQALAKILETYQAAE